MATVIFYKRGVEGTSQNAQVLTVAVVVEVSDVLAEFLAAAKTPRVCVINDLRRRCRALLKGFSAAGKCRLSTTAFVSLKTSQ